MKQLWKLWLLLALGISGCTPVLGQHLTKMSGYGYEMQGLSVDSMFFVPVRDTGFTGSYKRAGALVFRTIGTDRTLYAYDGIKWINVTASLSKGLDSMVISGDSLIAYLTNGSQVVTKLPLYGVKSSNGTVSIIGNAKVWGDSLDLSASGGSSGGLTRDSAKYPVWADTGIVVEGGANTQFIDTVKIKARYYDALWNAASLLGVPIDTSALSDRDVLTYFGGVWTNMPVNTQVIDTSSLSNRINAKLNITDTTGHWQPLGNYAPPIVAGTGITYNSTTGTVSAKISAAGGNALTTDGGGGMYVPQPVAGTDTTVKGVIYNPKVDDTIRLTTNTLDTIKARMHLNTAIDSGVFISATNQMHLYRFNGDSIVMTILGGAVTSVNGLTGNVQLNLSILGRVVSLTDGSSVTIPHDSLSLSGNNLSIKNSNTVDLSPPIKTLINDSAQVLRGYAVTINGTTQKIGNNPSFTVASVDSAVLAKYGIIKTVSGTNINLSVDSSKFATLAALADSLAGKVIFDTTTSSIPLHSIVGAGGTSVTNGDSAVLGSEDVTITSPTYSAGTNITITGTSPNYTINASGGGSGTDTVHQASFPVVLSRSDNVVTTSVDTTASKSTALVTQNQLAQHNSFDTTKFNAPTTDGKILFTGDGKMFHNGHFSLNPDSIWGAYPLGDSVSLPNTNLGNSDLSLSDAARWLNINDGGLYVIDSINITSPNSNYILGIDQNGLNVHWGKLKVAYTLPGTAGTDSIVVKHSGNEIRAISPKYYATPSQVVDSINAHAGTDTNTNLANTDLSLSSAVARKFELNGGTLTFNDLNRTYGDPVAVIGKEAIHLTTEDDGGSYSANYDLDYGTSPSITESVLSTGGSYARVVDSSGWLWKIGTIELMRLDGSGYTIDKPITIYPRSGSSASFHIGSDFISGVNYGGTGGTFKIDSVGNVTFPKYAGGVSAGQALSTDGSGGLELVSMASISSSAPNIITSTTDSSWTLSSTDNIVIIKPGNVWHETITLPASPSNNQEIKIYWITGQSTVSTDIIPGTGKTFYASDGTDYTGGETFVGDTFKYFYLKYDTATTTWYMLIHASTN